MNRQRFTIMVVVPLFLWAMWRQYDTADRHYRASEAYAAAGKYQESLAEINVAMDRGGSFSMPQALINRGELKRRLGDADGAVADASRAIELDPLRAEGFFARGVARHTQGNAASAIEDFTQAIALDPYYSKARLYRGTVLIKQGRLADGNADVAEAIRRQPDLQIDADKMLVRSAKRTP